MKVKVLIDKLDPNEREIYQLQKKRVDNMDNIIESAKEILTPEESNPIVRNFLEKLIGTFDTEACLLEKMERYFLSIGKAVKDDKA